MTEPEKVCPQCGRYLRCTFTGAQVYLAHTRKTHSADLFACFDCLTFHVYGLNRKPLVIWGLDPATGERVALPARRPDVVVLGDVRVAPYGRRSDFARVDRGDVYPLASALRYMTEECNHVEEIQRYLASTKRRRP